MEPKLLLVEDEPGLLEEMQTYLQREGFRVLSACTGKEALLIARSERPELVVLDWMLPGKSGIDVCRELRQTSHCGIIMVTARSDESDKIIGLEIGADDYLTKPFSLRELASRIRALLRRLRGPEDRSTFLERDNLIISEAMSGVQRRSGGPIDTDRVQNSIHAGSPSRYRLQSFAIVKGCFGG